MVLLLVALGVVCGVGVGVGGGGPVSVPRILVLVKVPDRRDRDQVGQQGADGLGGTPLKEGGGEGLVAGVEGALELKGLMIWEEGGRGALGLKACPAWHLERGGGGGTLGLGF